MPGVSDAVWLLLALATAVVALFGTRASIRYALKRRLIDQPGQRRSHSLPTPRGGGIAIVIAVVLSMLALVEIRNGAAGMIASMPLLGAIILVAVVGWIDDHRGLAPGWRLLAHCLAAFILGVPELLLLLRDPGSNPALPWIIAAALCCGLALVGSINLHNFMDGIDGLLGTQALFVFCVLAWICHQAGRLGEAQQIGLFAAATLGFLPFNFPRARIFMGDVGSGVLGLLIAVAVFRQMAAVPTAFWAGFIACSAFVVDSTATLLSRVLSGRRWYSAHREHLYQWLVRCGYSHPQVVGMYMSWNLAVALPMIYWSLRTRDPLPAGLASVDVRSSSGSWALALTYLMAVACWAAGKRYCLRTIRTVGSRST